MTYTVKRGDTLSKIAAKYGTTVGKIAAANKISNPNRISVGQVITIPIITVPDPDPMGRVRYLIDIITTNVEKMPEYQELEGIIRG